MEPIIECSKEKTIDLSKYKFTSLTIDLLSTLTSTDFTRKDFLNAELLIMPETCKSMNLFPRAFEAWFPEVREVIWPEIDVITCSAFEDTKIEYFQTKSCKEIDEDAFCSSSLMKFECPKNLKKINSSAFRNCEYLLKVDFSNAAIKIGNAAFLNCSRLTEVINIKNIESIGMCAFENTGLIFFEFPSNLEYLGTEVLKGCSRLKEVIFPKSSFKIPADTFSNCSSIERITNGESVTTIGAGAFFKSGITKVVDFPNVVDINDCAFKECRRLTEVRLGNKLINLGNEAFSEASSLKKVTFENSKVEILNKALFYECYLLSEINLNDTPIKIIEEKCFNWCGIKSISLPATLISIGESAFKSSNLIEIDVPNTVNYIGMSAFSNCRELKRVQWSNSCSKILAETFAFSNHLEEITNLDSVTQIGNNCFLEVNASLHFANLNTIKNLAFNKYTGIADLRSCFLIPEEKNKWMENNPHIILPYVFFE